MYDNRLYCQHSEYLCIWERALRSVVTTFWYVINLYKNGHMSVLAALIPPKRVHKWNITERRCSQLWLKGKSIVLLSWGRTGAAKLLYLRIFNLRSAKYSGICSSFLICISANVLQCFRATLYLSSGWVFNIFSELLNIQLISPASRCQQYFTNTSLYLLADGLLNIMASRITLFFDSHCCGVLTTVEIKSWSILIWFVLL